MNTVTEKGHGAYVYLDSTAEAAFMFGPQRFDETMEIAARSVGVTITLPWYFSVQKFYGEAISPKAPSDIEPQHLAPNDAMVFHQVLEACDPSVIVPSDPVHFEANWKDPKTYEMKTTVYDGTIADLLSAPKVALPKGRAVVAFAEALKAPTKAVLHAALDLANTALLTTPDDDELKSIIAIIPKHPKF
jgi:Ca-activated chloride channel family protein